MEVDKPPSSDKAIQTDEDRIVLELSENDPHFDKKKRLLQNMGLIPRNRFFLRALHVPIG